MPNSDLVICYPPHPHIHSQACCSPNSKSNVKQFCWNVTLYQTCIQPVSINWLEVNKLDCEVSPAGGGEVQIVANQKQNDQKTLRKPVTLDKRREEEERSLKFLFNCCVHSLMSFERKFKNQFRPFIKCSIKQKQSHMQDKTLTF